MMGTAYNLAFAPLLPWWSIGALAVAALLVVGLGLWRRARGLTWRVIAIVVLGGMVGVILLALYLPIFNLGQAMRSGLLGH